MSNTFKTGDKVVLRAGIVACGFLRACADSTEGKTYTLTDVGTEHPTAIEYVDDIGDTITICYAFVDLLEEK